MPAAATVRSPGPAQPARPMQLRCSTASPRCARTSGMQRRSPSGMQRRSPIGKERRRRLGRMRCCWGRSMVEEGGRRCWGVLGTNVHG